MRLMPARTAVCTAADIECDLPAPRPPRNNQHQSSSGGGNCASRAAKTQSSAASSPSPRISSSASSGVISLMSWRNWCMRSTSRKKRSAMAVILFHSFTIDDAIFSLWVSTTKQGETGLGVGEQREAVRRYLASDHGEQIPEFVETENGKRS